MVKKHIKEKDELNELAKEESAESIEKEFTEHTGKKKKIGKKSLVEHLRAGF